jgi:serpin B
MIRRFALTLGTLMMAACWVGPTTPGPGQTPQPPEVVYGTVRDRDRSGRADGADFTAVVAAQNALTVRLLAGLRDSGGDRNLAVGGFSLHQVLAMLYAGARGTTAADMQRVLEWTMPPDRLHAAMNALDLELGTRAQDVTLAMANRVWGQKGLPLRNEFLDVLARNYGAPLAVTDFAADPERARAAINDWVERATGDKIAELFPGGSIHGQTRLVLANAMYLDAPWKYKIDPARTAKAPFRLLDGTQATVDMMHYDEFLPSASDPQWQAVEIPYRGDELAMVVIVPSDLRTFEAQLTPQKLGQIFSRIQEGGIHLSLPRFEVSFHTSLKQALTGLGLGSLFAGADLSGITGSADLSVEHFEHEVFVEVDEEGTRAAAATGAALPASHGPAVTVDRPFLFAIRDRPTGTLLFLGRVVDPRPKKR